MIKKLMQFLKDEDGVTAVEYAVMAALIALIVIGGAAYLGNQVNDTFNTIGDKVPGNTTDGG